MSHADCDEVVNCRVYAMVLQWNLRVRMTGNATPTIAREEDAMTAVILAT
ncbi:hypothetical protein FocTR4_00004494 [Fusarium oxysporum f. sp. cubense]|nr:hypothetical protein FocTR4_00004494 [Fusarium oxysporum f. sp. cubense]